MKRKQIIALIMAGIVSCSIPVSAKDINEMTLEELKVAYLELQLEYEKLKASVAVDVQEETVPDETESAEEAVLMDEEELFKDILEGYSERQVISNRYSNAEFNMMTDDETVAWRDEAVKAEWSYMEKYQNAKFSDLNIQYLCDQYVKGLKKQMKACEAYFEEDDAYTHNTYWDSGYANRCYVIVELAEYYKVQFPADAVATMKEKTDYLDSLNEAETRNAAVDHATVQNVQQLLNDIGFFCGSADGISGKRTVKSIKRFQEMYGYEPADGMIDDELVQQLTEIKGQKK